jgi:hypothetical protein
MLKLILDICQPFTVIIFIISGIVSLILGLKTQGAINLCFAITNFVVFYGIKLFGK